MAYKKRKEPLKYFNSTFSYYSSNGVSILVHEKICMFVYSEPRGSITVLITVSSVQVNVEIMYFHLEKLFSFFDPEMSGIWVPIKIYDNAA